VTIRMRPIELAVIALCVVVSALSSSFASAGEATLHEVDQFSKTTRTRRYELTSPRDVNKARVEIGAKISEGTMRWNVLDRDGKSRWSGSTGKGSDIQISRSFDAEPGEWTLEIELRDATGSYDVRWSAR
jgi:hypothetical protein